MPQYFATHRTQPDYQWVFAHRLKIEISCNTLWNYSRQWSNVGGNHYWCPWPHV